MKKKLIAVLATGVMLTNIFAAAPVVMAQETGSSEDGLDLGSLIGNLVQELSEDPEVSELINSAAQQLENIDVSSLTAEDGPLAGLLNGDIDLNSLLSEDGPLAELLGENVDLESLFAEDGPLAGMLSEVQNEDGSIDYQKALNLLYSMFAADFSGQGQNADPSVVMDDYMNILIERFGEGDVSLPVKNIVAGGADENGYFTMLGDFWVYNYANEDGQLKFLSCAQQPALLTAVPTDDGSFQLEYDEAADGEGYDQEIARLCEEGTDMTAEEFFNATDEETRDLILFNSFVQYAGENPEITAFEYNGQMYTVEEAQDYINACYEAIWAAFENDTEGVTE